MRREFVSWKFIPSYEWESLGPGVAIPPGLEVRLSVDGTGQRSARIPPSWRLQVVLQDGIDSCRMDVSRGTTLAQVRSSAAAALAGGDEKRVETLLADGELVAGGPGNDHGGWQRTVEQAQLFGKRVSCVVRSYDALMGVIEAAVAEVERSITSKQLSGAQARSRLAQLEAQLDCLQCRGIDCADTGGSQAAAQERKQLTRRAELLQARLDGIFVGLAA